jgi:2-polyprenyl-3-methyl-5-hydroxy-6-metoxy-1,4-benzoquinol methylase
MKDYDGYNFEKFKALAGDNSLSAHEKTGFPDRYRADKGDVILEDICSKLPDLAGRRGLNVLDIGPGCSDVQAKIQALCARQGHSLFLADSLEMLEQIGDTPPFVTKVAGFFPDTCDAVLERSGGVDVVLCYSVFQYIFVEANTWSFIDAVLSLLNDGGQALIGDIPNNSKRRRFFSSPNGIRFHQGFMNTAEVPDVHHNRLEAGKIDDAVLFSVVLHCQNSGFDAYIVPQNPLLPFANRRDDLIIRKP